LTGKGSGKRGRPVGFRLSDTSRRAISISKTGQQHKQETRDKISRSLILYFRRKNPISVEMANRYRKNMDDETRDWIHDFGEELDTVVNIMTEKAMRSKCKIEITCGHNIEYFSHNITPELIVIFKEYCEENGLDPEDVLEEIYQ
jgi:hypothetical protein